MATEMVFAFETEADFVNAVNAIINSRATPERADGSLCQRADAKTAFNVLDFQTLSSDGTPVNGIGVTPIAEWDGNVEGLKSHLNDVVIAAINLGRVAP